MENSKRVRLILFAALCSIMASGGEKVYAQASYAPPNDAPNPYQSALSFGQLPNGREWDAYPGISVGRDNNIWVFDRCGRGCEGTNFDPILEYDPSGKLLKSFGVGLFSHPHGLYIDKEGNLWITDQGVKESSKGQQVFKVSPDGKVLMKIGKAGGAADDPETLIQPNSVVVAPNGDVFVADGHSPTCGASHIVKFTNEGKFVKVFGQRGSGPTDLMCPHSLAMDSKGRLFVADMGNKRVSIFDQDGKLIMSWKQFGRPTGLFIDTHDILYVVDSASSDDHEPLMKGAPMDYTYNPGCKRGIRIGSVKDGKVTAFIPDPNPIGQTSMGEGIVADHVGNLYQTPDPYNKNIKKYVKRS